MTSWWEKEPLRFECQTDCFKCCVKPGIVHFDRDDIRETSDLLEVSPAEFKKTYLVRDQDYWVLEVGKGGEPCTFLTDQGCSIHSGKPKQCSSYPFWRENLSSKSMWRLVGVYCPGIDIGPMISLDAIKSFLKQFIH
jgi:uncharacterized protein